MPVPLTDIEAAHHQPEFGDWDTDDRFCHECSERWPCPTTALCEALRIAVEGLDVAHEALATAGVVYTQVVTGSISDSEGWVAIEKALRGPPPEGSIIAYDLADALAAVRELVDLGEKP